MRDDQFVIMICNAEQCDSKLLQQTNANIKTFFFPQSLARKQKSENRKLKSENKKNQKTERKR